MPDKNSKSLSSRERRDLELEIEFLSGIVRRDPEFVDALQVLGDDFTRSGRYTDGLQVDQTLARLRPEDPLVNYNLACSLSLTEQYPEAFGALNRALDLGYTDFKFLARDPDLQNLRAHPDFKSIQARIRKLRAAPEE